MLQHDLHFLSAADVTAVLKSECHSVCLVELMLMPCVAACVWGLLIRASLSANTEVWGAVTFCLWCYSLNQSLCSAWWPVVR